MLRPLCCGLLAFSVALSSSVYASGNSIDTRQTAKKIESDDNKKVQKKYMQAIEKLEKYVYRNNDGTFKLAISKSEVQTKLHIDDEVYEQIKQGMETVNEGIRAGQYYSDDNRRVYVKGTRTEENLTRGGRNAYELHWWGLIMYLDSQNAQTLAGLLKQGASVASVAGFLSRVIPGLGTAGSFVFGAASAVASFQSGRILQANSGGSGVKLYYVGGPSAIPLWVQSQ